MSFTTGRDNAVSLARHDPKAALARARKIGDPWFRCQALAWVAWLTPEDRAFLKAAGEALDAAWCAPDPYRAAGASAWPVRALAERGNSEKALAATHKALGIAGRIENLVSRADALFLLFQAVFPLGGRGRAEAVAALRSACGAAGAKGQGHLRDAVLMLTAVDADAARRLVAAMREGREKRRAERRIAEGQSLSPRAFFWRDPKGPTGP